MDVFRIGVGGVPGMAHVAVALRGQVLVPGVRRTTTMTRLPTGRLLVVVAMLGVAVIAMPLAAVVVGVLTAAAWRFLVADVAVPLMRRRCAVWTFLASRGVGAVAVVGVRLMGRLVLLSAAMAALRGVVGVLLWRVPFVGQLVAGVGMADRGVAG
ncbi:hypothetical protein DRA43_01780 [Micromonospora provocatoris]|jgi:hypothetical protein|nr:hypothetical protein DRA43_01780 [Micromonospora provocatoris]